eukprot:4318795-Pleurochrysis_carterae.AAC.2
MREWQFLQMVTKSAMIARTISSSQRPRRRTTDTCAHSARTETVVGGSSKSESSDERTQASVHAAPRLSLSLQRHARCRYSVSQQRRGTRHFL